MKKLSYLIPFFCFVSFYAQNSALSEWQKTIFEKNQILAYENPMFLHQKDSLNTGQTALGYFNNHNSFRDAYMPEKTNGFNMQAQRFISVKKWTLYGNFMFSLFEDYKSNYTEMANPYTDNPYAIADSLQADWKKQYYLLETKAVSPYINSFTKVGLGIKYEVLNGARQKDPRPLDKKMSFELSPGVSFDLSNKLQLGVNGYYNRSKQDLSISLENNLQPQRIYKMLGIGAYLYNAPILLSSTLSRSYEINCFGGGVSLGLRINEKNTINSIFTYKKGKEEVVDGITSPFKAGSHKYDFIEANFVYLSKGNTLKHNVSLNTLYKTTSDTEYIQSLNSSTQLYDILYSSEMHSLTRSKINFNYQLLKIDDNEDVKWLSELGATLKTLEEKYPSISNTRDYFNLLFNFGVTGWFNLEKGTFSISYAGKYLKNLNESFVYLDNTNSTNFVAHQIAYPNHIYSTTNYLSNDLNVQYTFGHFFKNKAQLYLKLGTELFTSVQNNSIYEIGLDNTSFLFSVGFFN